jgi:hypothetical protein
MFTRRYTNFWDGLFRPSKTHILGSGEVKTFTNLVSNGNFVDATGWTGSNSSISVSDNIGTSTLLGSAAQGGFVKSGITPVIGHKYAATVRVMVTNSACTSIKYYTSGGDNGTLVTSPNVNEWYQKTIIITNGYATQNNYIYHFYPSAAIASGKVMKVQYVSLVDLTAAFGAGNEPSLTDYTNWIATQSNSWFSTTAQYLCNTNQWF